MLDAERVTPGDWLESVLCVFLHCSWFAERKDCIELVEKPVLQHFSGRTATLHPFSGLFSRTAWVSRYQKGKTSLDLIEARGDGVLGCSGISCTICKQSAPDYR